MSTCSAKTDLAPASLHGERHQTQQDGEWCRREAGMKTVVAVMMFLTCCSDGGLASAGCMTGGSLQVSEGVSGRLILNLSTRKEDVRVRCCKCAVALPELCGRRQRDGVTKRISRPPPASLPFVALPQTTKGPRAPSILFQFQLLDHTLPPATSNAEAEASRQHSSSSLRHATASDSPIKHQTTRPHTKPSRWAPSSPAYVTLSCRCLITAPTCNHADLTCRNSFRAW